MKNIKAFSLLEILIAIALGSFITLGLAEIYFSHHKNYQYQKSIMQATQNGMMASSLIETILAQTGYVGCSSLDDIHISNHINSDDEISAVKILNKNDLQASFSNTPLSDSRLLQLSFMSSQINDVLQDMTSNHYMTVSDALPFDKGDVVMISNCTKADIFTIDDVYIKDSQQIIYTDADVGIYKRGDIISQWRQPILYVANTERHDNLGNLIPALYWHQLNGSDDELVEGISHFYVTIKNKKITIHLTSISLDKITEQSQQWQFVAYV